MANGETSAADESEHSLKKAIEKFNEVIFVLDLIFNSFSKILDWPKIVRYPGYFRYAPFIVQAQVPKVFFTCVREF